MTISQALFRGPDFQRLPGTARWTFVCLKQNMTGAAGIDLWYEAELVARLAVETGWPANVVIADLAILQDAGWVRRDPESNVVWVVDHLTYDPHARAHEPKKRTGIQHHVAALPRRQIVVDYIEHHPEWFPHKECKEQGLEWAIDTKAVKRDSKGSPGRVIGESSNNSTNTSTSTKASTKVPASREAVSGSSWPAVGAAWWRENVGQITEGKFGKLFKPVVDQHGWERTLAGMQEYVSECKRSRRTLNSTFFVGESTHWIELAAMPTTDEHGDLTERGKRLAGMAA